MSANGSFLFKWSNFIRIAIVLSKKPNPMRIAITICFLSCSLIEYAQNTYAVDDYFISSNPSAFAEKKLFVSNTSSIADLNSSPTITPLFNNFFAFRQRVGSFSIGLNNGFNQWGDWKTVGAIISAAYSTKINRKLTLNSGLSASVRRDNLTFIECGTPPVTYFTLWNPPSYNMNIGMSLLHRNWTLGIAGNNLIRSEIIRFPYSSITPFSISTHFSYRFDLDTAKHISLTPSAFYSNTVVEKSHDFFVSLSLGLNKHSLGISSTLNHNVGIFYHYNFNNKFFIGGSIGNNYSLLSSNIFNNSYYSGMLRLGYSIPASKRSCIGNPSF